MMLFKGSLVLTVLLLSVLTKLSLAELKMTTCSVGLLREGWKTITELRLYRCLAATGLITARTQHSQLYPPVAPGSTYTRRALQVEERIENP
jgi:hypothetical protein